jgi:hypothetical protein
MSFLKFFLLQTQRTGGWNRCCLGEVLVSVRAERWQGIWCKYCAHMYVNVKMRSVETTPGMGGGGNKGEQ